MEITSSLELRTKRFKKPNIQLATAIDEARALETARCQASSIVEEEREERVKDRHSKTPSRGFGKHKSYACGNVGHFAHDQIFPVRGKTCAKLGGKGHWAACCRSEAKKKEGGREGGGVRDGERVVTIRAVRGMLNMIHNQGTGKLIR